MNNQNSLYDLYVNPLSPYRFGENIKSIYDNAMARRNDGWYGKNFASSSMRGNMSDKDYFLKMNNSVDPKLNIQGNTINTPKVGADWSFKMSNQPNTMSGMVNQGAQTVNQGAQVLNQGAQMGGWGSSANALGNTLNATANTAAATGAAATGADTAAIAGGAANGAAVGGSAGGMALGTMLPIAAGIGLLGYLGHDRWNWW